VIIINHDALTAFGVHVIAVDGNDKKDVLHIGLDLTDENFFKTHFTWSTDAIKGIVVSS